LRSILKRCIGALTALIAALGGIILISPAASAAITYCNHVNWVEDVGQGNINYPTYMNSSGGVTVNCDFRINENGTSGQREAIAQLQRSLNVCYGPNRFPDGAPAWAVTSQLAEDGEYGSKTQEAVRQVQNYLNNYEGRSLTVDGYAGPRTRTAMRHETREGTFCLRAEHDPPRIWWGP
jgi:peptidoglycan hydrolase-like protein with peptidoglycan-binding domain